MMVRGKEGKQKWMLGIVEKQDVNVRIVGKQDVNVRIVVKHDLTVRIIIIIIIISIFIHTPSPTLYIIQEFTIH